MTASPPPMGFAGNLLGAIVARGEWTGLGRDLLVYVSLIGLTNVLSYAYLVVAARALSPESFAVLGSLVGILTVVGVVAASHQLEVTLEVARSSRPAGLGNTMLRSVRATWLATAIGTIAGASVAGAISATVAHAVICGAVVQAMFVAGAASGFLGGIGGIRIQAAIALGGATSRLAAGWALMWSGAGITGALFGYFVNYIAIAAIVTSLCRSTRADVVTTQDRSAPVSPKATLVYVAALAPLTLDQALVQLLAPVHGGPYAALATIAKTVFYVSYPAIAVIHSRMARTHGSAQLLSLSLIGALAVVALAGTTALVLALNPTSVEQLLFGGRYAAATPALGRLSLTIALFSLCAYVAHVLTFVSMSIAIVPCVIAVAVAVVLSSTRTAVLATIVDNMLLAAIVQVVVTLAVLALLYVRHWRQRSPTASRRVNRSAATR